MPIKDSRGQQKLLWAAWRRSRASHAEGWDIDRQRLQGSKKFSQPGIHSPYTRSHAHITHMTHTYTYLSLSLCLSLPLGSYSPTHSSWVPQFLTSEAQEHIAVERVCTGAAIQDTDLTLAGCPSLQMHPESNTVSTDPSGPVGSGDRVSMLTPLEEKMAKRKCPGNKAYIWTTVAVADSPYSVPGIYNPRLSQRVFPGCVYRSPGRHGRVLLSEGS